MAPRSADDPSGRECRRRPTRRPALTVALGAVLVAVGQALWIWTHRHRGGYDADESGHVAIALRFHRSIDFAHPLELLKLAGSAPTGPLVPLLSVPLLILGPRDPRTVLLVQPVLAVVGALFVAGIAHRLSGPRTAVVSGLAWMCLPTVILATQSYWLGLGAATATAGAIWALLASDRCANRTIWWFGVCVGCLLLARAMSIAFLPGIVLAGVIVAGPEAARLRRLAAALGLGLAIAAPWWIAQWSSIWDYLLGYGYGDRAALFGNGGPVERVGVRLDRISEGVGPPVAVTALIAVVVAAACSARRGHPDRWSLPRNGLAVAVASLAGFAALATTTNEGGWFELPVIALVVPLAAAVIASLPRPLAFLPAVPVIGMAVVQLAAAWWVVPWQTEGIPWLAENHIHAAHFEDGFSQADQRFARSNRPRHAAAAADWWALSRDVARALRPFASSQPDTVFSTSGNTELFNSNTLTLAAELDSWTPRVWVPETATSSDELERELAPNLLDTSGRLVRRCCDGKPTPRILVVALHGGKLFTPDREVRDFARRALSAGWRVSRAFPMPGGGRVEILRHPRSVT